VSGAGDVNGDGKSDVLVGALGSCSAGSIWSGAAYLLSGPVTGTIDLSAADARSWDSGDEAGYAVPGAGDMDGDGTADVAIAPRRNDGAAGVTYLVLGPRRGTIDLALADAFFVGEKPDRSLGASASADAATWMTTARRTC
jgi:hypothetical protein